jgi:glycosyltransferase involved in cell wall biosynthesis
MSKQRYRKTRVLIIGTITQYVSGTSISLKQLVNMLRGRKDIEMVFINTVLRRKTFFGQIECVLRTSWATFRKASWADVVTFHVNEPQKGIPIWLLTKIWRKPFVVRWFGGMDYRKSGSAFRRAAALFLLRQADVNLKQTKWLKKRAEDDGSKQTIWYSTSRLPPKKQVINNEKKQCRRFIFAGQVKPTKGVFEIIDAGERFGEGITIDVYGDFFSGISDEVFKGLKRVRYGGTISSESVISVMAQHDALLLPTYHIGEGYPGVIVEAYFAGIPVICTNWQSIPEIVDKTSGLFVSPRDTNSLYLAMNKLVEDDKFYAKLQKGAKAKRKMFSAQVWTDYFALICRKIASDSLESKKRISLLDF